MTGVQTCALPILHFENTARTWGTIDHAVLCGDLAAQETFREAMEDNLSTPLICLDAFKEMSFVPGTDANAAFMPGASPPLVSTPILFMPEIMPQERRRTEYNDVQ